MADSDGSPQPDDRHHRRSRSRSPISPEWTGETPAEREERRLAEAAVLVRPPAGQPRVASADTGPSTQEPEPAEVTAPAAQAVSPAALPREGAPDAREAETAAPARSGEGPTTPHISHNPTNTPPPHTTYHTPHTPHHAPPPPAGPSQEWRGTAHHHRQRNPARSGGE